MFRSDVIANCRYPSMIKTRMPLKRTAFSIYSKSLFILRKWINKQTNACYYFEFLVQIFVLRSFPIATTMESNIISMRIINIVPRF
jgi:hypothetical protein